MDRALDSATTKKFDDAVKVFTRLQHLACSLEAIALAQRDIDDIYLDCRIAPKVGDRSGRTDVGEDDVIVVPDSGCAFRREVGRAVGTDGRDKAQLLFLHDATHVGGEDAHAVCHGSR